jgi:hypothetical protein
MMRRIDHGRGDDNDGDHLHALGAWWLGQCPVRASINVGANTKATYICSPVLTQANTRLPMNYRSNLSISSVPCSRECWIWLAK